MNSCPHCHATFPNATSPPPECPECRVPLAAFAGVTVSDTRGSGAFAPGTDPATGISDDDRDASSAATVTDAAVSETFIVPAPSGATVTAEAEAGGAVRGEMEDTFIRPPESPDAGSDDSDDDNPAMLKTNVVAVSPDWSIAASQPGVSDETSLKVARRSALPATSTLVIPPRRVRPVSSGPKSDSDRNADYDLMDVLGKGGMGVVFAARQASIDRTVAIKMLKPGTERNMEAGQKFLSEACVTGDLEHPNIVPIYDLGMDSRGSYFYAMKRVQGTPWKNVIRQKTLEENLEILLRVADAVAFAHSKGIIHRDLKPENTMLGEFGEVLVMDWGLAMPIDPERCFGGIRQQPDFGGTPAYMAPEMVLGPLSAIGVHSDIYLLGAILYEIVTGLRPHKGTDATGCVAKAAKNDIQKTDKTGELVTIALTAMRTDPRQRYGSVIEFQNVLRICISHSESILLSDRATEHLQVAAGSGEYDDYNRALFGFQQAIELWEDNQTAISQLAATRLAYARTAQSRGDFDLGAGLLDLSIPEHAAQHVEIREAARQRDLRQVRARIYQRVGLSLAALLFIVISGAAVWINRERNFALEKKTEAENNWQLAEVRRAQVENEKAEVERQKIAVEEQRNEAKRQEIIARDNEQEALIQKSRAEDNMMLAQQREMEAVAARRAEAYEAYVARIGSAAARIEENAHDQARELLLQCIPEQKDDDDLRNWEWHRLWYLCQQAVATIEIPFMPECLDVVWSADNEPSEFVVGGENGMVEIRTADGNLLREIRTTASTVYAVAISPKGNLLAIASDSPSEPLKIVDLISDRTIHDFEEFRSRNSSSVLSLEFSADATLLLTASSDGTAAVHHLTEPRSPTILHGHRDAVTRARFSPMIHSERHQTAIVTVSRDGAAIVWNDPSGLWTDSSAIRPGPPFSGHFGPVLAAAISPDGQTVATAGHDQRILIWSPSDLAEFDFEAALSGQASEFTPTRFSAPYKELSGHTASVRDLTFSANGKTLLSAGNDNTVRIWNVSDGAELKILRGHGQWISAIRPSPDGTTAFSVSYDRTVRRWDLRGYEETRVLRATRLDGHIDAVLDGRFSASADHIVTASRDRTIQLWDGRTGQPLRTLREGHRFLVSTGVFSDDGLQMATAAVDGTVRIWDTGSGSQRHVLTNTGRSPVVAFSPDGRFLVTGGPPSRADDAETVWSARLWDCSTGDLIHELSGHPGRITAAAFSPDGKSVYCGDTTGRGTLWSPETGQPLRTLNWHTAPLLFAAFIDDRTLVTAAQEKAVALWNPADGNVDHASLLLHPDQLVAVDSDSSGQHIATCCTDGTVRLWDRSAGRTIHEWKVSDHSTSSGNPVTGLSLSRDGSQIVIADSARHAVRMFVRGSDQEITARQPDGSDGPFLPLSRSEQLRTVRFTPDGTGVLTIGGDQTKLWDRDTGRLQFRRLRTTFSPHGSVASVDFSRDQKSIISGSDDGTAVIWDAETGQSVRKLTGAHTGPVNCAAFSPEPAERLALTVSDDATAVLWNSADGTFVRRLTGHEDRILWGAFSPDGARLVTTSADQTARIWTTTAAPQPLHVLHHRAAVTRAAFSADGTRLATACRDNSASIWDTTTGLRLQHILGHMAPVNSLTFSDDGKRLFTAADDFHCKVWDTATGKELMTLKGHTRPVSSVTFSTTTGSLLSTSHDGTAVLWLTGR